MLPNALTEGFVHNQGLGTGRPSFLLGDFSTFGWWQYFPVAIALKTQTVLLVLIVLALVTRAGRRTLFGDEGMFLVLPMALFLAIAMAAAVNIGLRHVLPIYPFMIVAAAGGVRALLSARPQRFRILLIAVAFASVLEAAWAYPDPLTFFNVFAGGPRNGFRSLADSNVDWGQALKPLSFLWMRDNNVPRINLAYFGTADPKYYGMDVHYIWGTIAPNVAPAQQGPPELPGYVAVSATMLDGVPLDDRMRAFFKPLRDRVPTADIDGAIKVFWIDQPWW